MKNRGMAPIRKYKSEGAWAEKGEKKKKSSSKDLGRLSKQVTCKKDTPSVSYYFSHLPWTRLPTPTFYH